MNGHNRVPSGRFENLDCPVEVGEECVMPDRRGWHTDKGLNPVYIGALISIVVGILLWAGGPGGVNSHFAVLDLNDAQHEKDVKTIDKRVDAVEKRTDDQLKNINDKLDRLIERGR